MASEKADVVSGGVLKKAVGATADLGASSEAEGAVGHTLGVAIGEGGGEVQKAKKSDVTSAMCERLVAAADQKHAWTKIRELKNPKPAISHLRIVKRKLPGSAVAMVAIHMTMPRVTPQVAMRNVVDTDMMKSWAQSCENYEVIHRFDDGRIALRGVFKFPYPMADREMVEVRAIQLPKDNDLGAYLVVYEAADDEADFVPKESPKLVRGHTFLTGYIIQELPSLASAPGAGSGGGGPVGARGSGPGCRVTYISYADVKLSGVPSFVLNKVAPNIAEDFVYQFAAGCEKHLATLEDAARCHVPSSAAEKAGGAAAKGTPPPAGKVQGPAAGSGVDEEKKA